MTNKQEVHIKLEKHSHVFQLCRILSTAVLRYYIRD